MKFSIRDLFLVTVIVALALGWLLHHRVWVEAYSTKTYESEIWQARTEELQARTEMLIGQSRATCLPNSTPPVPIPPKH